MRVIANLIVFLLIFSLISPYVIYADESSVNKVVEEKSTENIKGGSGDDEVSDINDNQDVSQNIESQNEVENKGNENDIPIEELDQTSRDLEKQDLTSGSESNIEQEDPTKEADTSLDQQSEEVRSEPKDKDVFESTVLKTVKVIEETNTSKLGHIRSESVQIYEEIGNTSTAMKAGSTYTNAVYYIKKQARYGEETYYLISKNPSSTTGVVGWVKAADLSTTSHVGLDKEAKTFYVKGTGSAYGKAWGGSKDVVYGDLTSYAGKAFKVHLTEKVGNDHWYRGTLGGKTVWIHPNNLVTKEESRTSRLGHLKSGAVKIYQEVGDTSGTPAGSTYTNAVYYIKKQATYGEETYYLISKNPSSTTGVVGWVKATDLSTASHVGIDKEAKTFYIKGTGEAYNKAWGGNKDLVFRDLSEHIGQEFKVHLTEKVGNDYWYRGTLDGKTVWIHPNNLSQAKYSYFDITLNQAIEMQMKVSPQTDKEYAYVSAKYINENKVEASVLNVRKGPGANYSTIGSLTKGATVSIVDEVDGWYQIHYVSNTQWVNAGPANVLYYMDPQNFLDDEKQRFQFLDLSKPSGASQSMLNSFLAGKGVLDGHGEEFYNASRLKGINDLYLVSHAVLETGHGTSILSKGDILVGEVSENKWVSFQPDATYIAEHVYDAENDKWNWVVTKDNNFNRNNAKNVKKVYNMFGINAVDSNPYTRGSVHAYQQKWFTPELAIIGGAQFVADKYINVGQNTLYKMRWNPDFMVNNGYASHQYASDIGWASKQIYTMYDLYKDLGISSLSLDIPVYK
ncbi:N-acetylglucosaminidase [Oceanobacillus picturae]|uniref:N-acetylglucosaminidase n=1 Tax=Oceanobacillus picturae TaxID=171693 RepID=UPI0036434053